MAEQNPFIASAEFAMNREQRCACVLLLDTSGSMLEIVSGAGRDLGRTIQMDGKTYNVVSGGKTKLDYLNEGLAEYKTAMMSDSLAAKRVEVSIITFGGTVQPATPFVTAEHFEPPRLDAGGDTPMGAAIFAAIDTAASRKQLYKANGIPYFRPWIFLLTDGEPTDEYGWRNAAERVQAGVRNGEFVFFTVGVQNADFEVLKQINTSRPPAHLDPTKFKEMFIWLSSTQKSLSRSRPEDEKGFKPEPITDWGTL
jgi:uncharacterized protein YegL